MDTPSASPLLPSGWALLTEAKASVMKRKSLFFTVVAIPGIITLIAQWLFEAELNVLAIVLVIVGVIGYIYAGAAIILAFDQEGLTSWKAAYAAVRGKFWPYIWVSILVALVTAVGFILLIIPGIYLSLLFAFAGFAVLLEGKRGWSAARRSHELVKGRWWSVFGRLLLAGIVLTIIYGIIITIASFIDEQYLMPIVDLILSIVITPIYIGVYYFLYQALKQLPAIASVSTSTLTPATPAGI